MSLTEQMVLSRIRRLTRRDLRHWMHEGWVRPAMGEAGPVFDEIDVARLRLLCDLRKDMALPSDALPVVLTLIDRLHETRRELRILVEALAEQPEEVRRTVISRLHTRAVRDSS